jgi:homoserine kinase
VRVPASSANLGPGFDALGVALALHAEVGVVGVDVPPEGARTVEATHPASVAFRRAGGEGEVWVRSPIPTGRGLGFSGAVRVGGLLAAHQQRHGGVEVDDEARHAVLALATELEGHPDNVAASLLGGVVVAAAGHAVCVPLGVDPAVVVWIPSFQTFTDQSRAGLPDTVPFADAVFNVGRTGLLVAALAAGDVASLREAAADRLHQPTRLAAAEPSARAIAAALAAGAWGAWLSGSGPTVAMWCDAGDADDVAVSLPADGHTKVLCIDHEGAMLTPR